MNLPELGPSVPQNGNIVSKSFGRFVLSLLGWKVEGEFPNLNKVVIIFAPHFSYWDGIYTIATKVALGINAFWLGKKSLFIFPLGILMRYLGGIPTVRDRKTGAVKQISNEFTKREHLVLVIAPEGTRGKVKKWKTGFYNIASEAKVPILLMYLDYNRKVLGFGEIMNPTGDIEKDMEYIKNYYKPYMKRKKV